MSQPLNIGVCIYCGDSKSELTDEHIIPFGFGNTSGDILHKASCKGCAAITSKFEMYIQRTLFQDARTVFQLKSRHSKQSAHISQKVIYDDGTQGVVDVPFDKFRSQIALPVFEMPSSVNGIYSAKDCNVKELQFINLGNTDRDDWYRSNGIAEMHANAFAGNNDHAFERFIIKIAYCAAVKIQGYEAVKGSPITKIIRGLDTRYATWLGNMEQDYFKSNAEKNVWIRYRVDEVPNGVVASVQLFAAISVSPVYNVIITEN